MLRKIIFNARLARSLAPSYRNPSQAAHISRPSARCFSSDSFLQSILNQVKKDLENDKSLQEAMQKLEQEAHISEKFSKLSEYVGRTRDFSRGCIDRIAETKDNSRIIRKCIDSGTRRSRAAKTIAVGFDRVTNYIYDEKGRAKRIKRKMNLQSRRRADRAESEAGAPAEDAEGPEAPPENSLVLAKESVWDRFGSKIRDMPFLSDFFGRPRARAENPLVSRLFGESSLAAALREMERVDPSFNLPDLMELVEHVIAPHVVECYLRGDHDALKLVGRAHAQHCGELAFNILNSSINERKLQKLELDPSILILKDVELKGRPRARAGGMKVKEGDPWLIFNFTTQQINCLRNTKGQVCAGRIDDIREVVYSMAISKHPKPLEPLEYPYMVRTRTYAGQRDCDHKQPPVLVITTGSGWAGSRPRGSCNVLRAYFSCRSYSICRW